MNRTELYQICRRAGLSVHPATPREYLIQYLTGEAEPPAMTERTHPIDRWRYGIIGFLLDYWGQLHAQLKCPARNLRTHDETKRNPRPCFGCLDQQVMSCLATNRNNEEQMRLYLPKGNS